MEHYIGVKIIKASPLTLGAYNEYRGWKLPEDEAPDSPGYLVEYLDGGKPNHPNHAGYISWSPKDIFNKAYICFGNVEGMPPHQQRVVAEEADLRNRYEKLCAFIGTDIYEALDKFERQRLMAQGLAMNGYLEVLVERIKHF